MSNALTRSENEERLKKKERKSASKGERTHNEQMTDLRKADPHWPVRECSQSMVKGKKGE